ncbi:lysylphosphatidylglycerol synthase domain-containing protein [Paenibacillus sp. RC67]|uniref:lysylphosphatidylglycerol synthase domain-containing protein n=1 Tax=Paenibacillus sp. RC67 TaxID=3039392 RepID=UPI0024AC9D6B|nr:lysylphosphatidylglycerol synthase domain-containing protein [Paenibacillus sp. RC67]
MINKKALFSVIVTIIVLVLCIKLINIDDMMIAITKINISTVLIGIIIYVVQFILRAYRLSLVLENLNTLRLMPFMMIYQFLLRILPFKSGEISYVVLLKKQHKVETSVGTSTLFLMRALDALSILYLVVFTQNYNKHLFFSLFLFIIFFILSSYIISLFLQTEKNDNIYILRLIKKYLGDVPGITLNKIVLLQFISLLIYVNLYIFAYFITNDLIQISISNVVYVVNYAFIGNYIPINGINVGTQEIGWMLGLSRLGYSSEQSALVTAVQNIVSLLILTILFISGWLCIIFKKSESEVNTDEINYPNSLPK